MIKSLKDIYHVLVSSSFCDLMACSYTEDEWIRSKAKAIVLVTNFMCAVFEDKLLGYKEIIKSNFGKMKATELI